MARKAKKTTKRKSSRRRVGAVALNAKSPMVQIGSAALGFFLAPQVNNMIDKVTGTLDAKIVGAGQAGLGAALMFMKLGKKPSLIQTVAGGVLAGAGAKRLLQALGVINGYGAVPVIGQRMLQSSLNGYRQVPVLQGYQVPASVNGVFNGYNVPPTPKSTVMGSVNGGYSNDGSSYMN